MASWNAPTLYGVGDALAVSSWNNLANDATFLYQAPYAIYYNSVAVSVTSGVITQMTLGGTVGSGYGFAVTSNNAIVPLAGTYIAMGQTKFTSGSTSFAACFIQQNGSTKALGINDQGAPTGETSPQAQLLICAASDAIALYASQNTGGSLNSTTGAANTYLSLAFVGSQ